jgi:hypothetical protein
LQQLSFRLKNVRPADLEYQLLRLGLKTEVNPDLPADRYTTFRWKQANQPMLGVRVDRTQGSVEIEGTETAVRMWRNLISVLDSPPTPDATTQVGYYAVASGATFSSAAADSTSGGARAVRSTGTNAHAPHRRARATSCRRTAARSNSTGESGQGRDGDGRRRADRQRAD